MTMDASHPFAALATLPINIAVLYEWIRYVFIITLGAYTWDWLTSLHQEYEMIKKGGLTLPVAVHLASRFVTEAFVIVGVVCLITPLPNCHAILLSISIISVFTGVTTTYLFLLRVRAIFHDNRWMVGLFSVLCFSVCASSLVVPFSVHGGYLPGTRLCVPLELHPRTGVYALLNIINHTLIFICVSWKLVAMQQGLNGGIRNIVRGRGFSRISGVLWTSGQLYFFTTIGIDVVNLSLMISPQPLQQFMLVTATIALENAMACRIFRQLMFDSVRRGPADTSAIVQNNTLPLEFRTYEDGYESQTGEGYSTSQSRERDETGTELSSKAIGVDKQSGFTSGAPRSPSKFKVEGHMGRNASLDKMPSDSTS